MCASLYGYKRKKKLKKAVIGIKKKSRSLKENNRNLLKYAQVDE